MKVIYQNKILFIILTLSIFFRIYLGELTGAWFPSDQAYDDALLINYALYNNYTSPDHLTLLKTMGYPWFLKIVSFTGLDYTIFLSLIWSFSSLLILKLVYVISSNKLISYFFFIYILFMPTAFEIWAGTRLYRNSILAPFTIIVFYYITIQIVYFYKSSIDSIKKRFLFFISSIFLGVFFTFTYYIKEDGVWLLACLLASILLSISLSIVNLFKTPSSERKGELINVGILFVPLIIFNIGTNMYKSFNLEKVGVAEIETRTQGELGLFVRNIYKIASYNRNGINWAPADAIDKAYNVSKTFQQYPELRNKIIHTPWFSNDAYQDPIRGDFLTWVLRTALTESGTWKTEKQVNDLFYNINRELDEAFSNNSLEKEKNRIQIVSSMGGRSWEEIRKIMPLVGKIYRGNILLKGYSAGSQPAGNTKDLEIAKKAAELTGISYLTDYSKMNNGIVNNNKANDIIENIFKIYKLVNIFLFILSISILIYVPLFCILNTQLLKERFHQYKDSIAYAFAELGFLLLSFIYSVAIAWFSEFIFLDGVNMTILNFYSVINSVLLAFFYIFGLITFCKLYTLRKLK